MRWITITALCLLVISAINLQASPSYYCYRTDEAIRIDGQLDEAAWQDVPGLAFLDLVDGAVPKYPTRAKMLWDDQYFYVGIEAQDENVWAVIEKEAETPWNYLNPEEEKKFVMAQDPFVKIYIDPDGDGRDYLELHINPHNKINDAWVEVGSRSKVTQEGPGWNQVHYYWDCAGIKSAVRVDGTLNNPSDKDKSWTVEVAIPWKSLAHLTKGKCPPQAGTTARVHLGRVYRTEAAGKRNYWTWPVIGILDCHQTDRYGYVNFSADPAVMKKTEGREKGNPLKWKMAWVWSMNDKPPAEVVDLAKSLGFNAIQAGNAKMVEECHKKNMKAFGVVWFGSAGKEYEQKMLPDENDRLKWDNPAKELDQHGGEPLQGGEILYKGEPWCLDRPEALEYGKKRIDDLISQGHDGIALDAAGYKNYYACFCRHSREKQEVFRKAHPDMPTWQAIQAYSEQCLVDFCNALIAYAKAKKPDIETTCHIYPDFAPDPLYGNKIAFDYCGQTVSWFFNPHWDFDKIARYSYEVVNKGTVCHKTSRGAPFIGIYTLPPYEAHRKAPERVRKEIRIIKESGAQAIMLAELGNILNDPAIAEVVRAELTTDMSDDEK